MSRRVVTLAFLIALPTSLLAQAASTSADMSKAIAAYHDLDFDLAAILLRRALSRQLSDSQRIEALTHLGAVEHYRAQPDSATAVFGRLILLAPGYQPDTLIFPPEITRLYDDVKVQANEVTFAKRDLTSTPAPLPSSPLLVPLPPPLRLPTPAATLAETAHDLRGQQHGGIIATGGASLVNVHAASEAGGLAPASGTVLGLTANVRYQRFELGIRYMEGSLQTRDMVEGAAALRFATTSWLALQTGAQIRRYETLAGAERWVTWHLGARAEAPIIGASLRGHAVAWLGSVLSVNVPPGSGTTRGGELGVTFAQGPVWFGLEYGIDQAAVHGATRRETVKTLSITAGLRRP